MTSEANTPALLIRAARADDVDDCGRICHDAFAAIAHRHRFVRDFPSVAAATDAVSALIGHPQFFGVVAERDGRVVGSNYLDERSTIASVGPLTVEPDSQDRRVGTALLETVLDRAKLQGVPGVRLVQAAYHNRSLSLYAKFGFEVREPLVTLQGNHLGVEVEGCVVRPATEDDIGACDALCVMAHGHDRGGELRESVTQQVASVVEHNGRITGYTTGIGFFAHSVAETNDDLCALIGAAPSIGGPGLILPMRNTEMFRWCLARGLRVVHTLNLMTIGLYHEPRGAYLPSIGY
ncbi:GNAT family N-acetyltransferase [Mycobacterium sp. AZCC_0083]|uniref:GNAT family N-acetyltransferase n=1 Tax=Mycobacterium sp. AZCC_0083 TaxID=2735882 RepID=UPI00161AD864|nr:GNAT family N-acetyltransferase [Mycobacterium sp. AZCC_0083]MBB5167593.1 putative N-acetyltransferase YhbS [Mycobacterium sp. AZCC_0083]